MKVLSATVLKVLTAASVLQATLEKRLSISLDQPPVKLQALLCCLHDYKGEDCVVDAHRSSC